MRSLLLLLCTMKRRPAKLPHSSFGTCLSLVCSLFLFCVPLICPSTCEPNLATFSSITKAKLFSSRIHKDFDLHMSRKAGLAEGVLVVGVCEGFVVLDVVHHHFFWKDRFVLAAEHDYLDLADPELT